MVEGVAPGGRVAPGAGRGEDGRILQAAVAGQGEPGGARQGDVGGVTAVIDLFEAVDHGPALEGDQAAVLPHGRSGFDAFDGHGEGQVDTVACQVRSTYT